MITRYICNSDNIIEAYRQADRQADRRADRRTDRWADRQTDRQAGIQTDRQRQTDTVSRPDNYLTVWCGRAQAASCLRGNASLKSVYEGLDLSRNVRLLPPLPIHEEAGGRGQITSNTPAKS